MSLDKQRILNELGSVMNQLQNADCGCMGKLFTNLSHGGQGGTTVPAVSGGGGCRRGCCHGHSYNYNLNANHGCNHGTPGAGDQAHPMNFPSNMNPQCNPSKLYTDTYNYLNKNLMQPVAQEVYNDLKTITPDNTVMNNALAAKMGFSSGENRNSGFVDMNAPLPHNNLVNSFHNMPAENSQPNVNTGGMGPQIVNMFMGDSNKTNHQKLPVQGGQCTGSLISKHIQESNNNQCNVTNPYVIQANNEKDVTNMNSVPLVQNPCLQSIPNNISLPSQQKKILSQYPYGQHTQAIMKFNEMFPGVAQADLGYDPMAIAIQMNPANQQKTAMNSMQTFLNNAPQEKPIDCLPNANMNNPALDESQAAKIVAMQPQIAQCQQGNALLAGEQINQSTSRKDNQELAPSEQYLQNNNMKTVVDPSFADIQQQKQVHLIPETAISQQQSQPHNQSLNQNKNSNSRAFVVSNNSNGLTSQYHQQTELRSNNNERLPLKDVVKEPILPFDDLSKVTSQKNCDYNTLGQSIERFPPHLYRTPQASLPQTLSPQYIPKLGNGPRYSNVKFTESKTSLMGNKATRKTPSRNQLQHIYNQYKGSQSYTQQTLNPVTYGPTLSDGKLNVVQANANATKQNVPVEKNGGDTIANLQRECENHVLVAKEQDVLIPATHQGDSELIKPTSGIPTRQAKCRNGLQDVVYTTYPSSAAWSFHGTHDYRAVSRGRQFRR